MKKAILIWIAIQLTVSAFAARRVTIDQLNHVVDSTTEDRTRKLLNGYSNWNSQSG